MLHSLFLEDRAGHSLQPKQREEPNSVERFSDDICSETFTQGNRVWLERAAENITLELRCQHVTTGGLEIEKGQSLPSLVCVEPTHISIQGVLPARVLSLVSTATRQPSQLSAQPGCFKSRASDSCFSYVTLANFSDTPLTSGVSLAKTG